jgi:hypothetical protein
MDAQSPRKSFSLSEIRISTPNHHENALKDAIDSKRARCHEYRVPFPVTLTLPPNPHFNLLPSEKTKKLHPAENTSEVSMSWHKQKATEYSTLFPKKQRTTTQ